MEIKTHKETDLWKFNEAVIHRETNKVIFQPRILCWYGDRVFHNGQLPAPYTGMTEQQLYKELGVSNRCYFYNGCFRAVEDPRITHEDRVLGPLETEHIVHCPVGDLNTIYRGNTSNYGVIPVKWPITCEEDMKVHMWMLEHITYEWDQEEYDRQKELWGFAGLPQAYYPRSNMQYLFHDVMGTEESIYALYDYPETVEKYFAALQENQDRYGEVWAHSPIEMINYADNIHAGILSPELFKKYTLPEFQRRNDYFHQYGKWTFSHWDGDCKPLLPYAQETGLDGIEAITPLPQGDVTLKETREALGDKMFLLDGVAAILFDPDLYPIEMMEDQVRECLDLFGGHLILGISDELCSTADINRVIRVRDMVDEYNSHVD